MARRTKAQDKAIGILVIFGVVIAAISNFIERIGVENIFVLFVLCIMGYFAWKYASKRKAIADLEKRRLALMGKYNDGKIVSEILNNKCWIGQTSEQLLDSFGPPAGKDQKVLKTKTKEVWKYGQFGSNRFRQRITLENDTVVGWDDKT